MNRVTFLVDGFNLYHSLREAEGEAGVGLRWLDLRGLLESYRHVIDGRPTIREIRCFSALAHHRLPQDPGVVQRHRTYLRALESTGVRIHLGRFKACQQVCKCCRRTYQRFEEKETDVALAVALIETLLDPEADTVVLVSGDTDLSPALRAARARFPDKRVGIAFPFRRLSEELKRLADLHWRLKPVRYAGHQFPNPLHLPDGTKLAKPVEW